jgi:hypothetical protein
MTPQLSYFMPTPGLTAGEHTYAIDAPGMPETTLPFFYMWMTMWADQLNLHKGQHTTYHCKLDLNFNSANSLWNSSSSSSFFPSDLVSSAELQNSPMPGASRKGTITLSITNGSPGVITMKNVFETFDASRFEPQGSIQVDGGVGAIQDGSFSIIGVAHAYLQPVLGLGLWPGTTAPITSTPTSEPLFPNYGWSLTPTSTGASSNPNCPTGGMGTTTTDPTGSSTASSSSNFNLPISHCMGSAALDLYTKAIGGQSTAEIGNPPTQDEIDAARTRVADATQKAKDAETKFNKADDKWAKAWVNGLYHTPQDVHDNFSKVSDEELSAHVAWDKASDELIKNSSAENNAKLEAASVRLAAARDAYDKAEKDVLDHFTPEDRAAYDAATNERLNAAIDRSLANEELRDAREALDKLPPPSWLKYAF